MNGRSSTRIARPRHSLQIKGTPVMAVMFGSLLASALPIIAQVPLLPPFGLMIFVAWRLIRPDIWPLWIALPLGLFDDIMSGQPLGSAVLLWTLILLGLDMEHQRNFWRDYWHDWLIGGFAIAFALLGGWFFVHLSGNGGSVVQIVPQIAYSIGLLPLIVRICAALDRWRLP
jgi:rod shape-determining protein MreD